MRILIAIISLVVLGACVTIVPGTSRETDVLAHFGTPAEQRQLPDGGRVLEFPRSPLGHENWRVTLAADGTVRAVEQLLDEPHFARLKPGMTKSEVRLELGRPAESETQIYPNLNEEVWTWRYLEPQRRMFFNAHFDQKTGKLKYTSRTEESYLPINDMGT